MSKDTQKFAKKIYKVISTKLIVTIQCTLFLLEDTGFGFIRNKKIAAILVLKPEVLGIYQEFLIQSFNSRTFAIFLIFRRRF